MLPNAAPINILVIEDNPADFILLRECLAESMIATGRLVCTENLADAFMVIEEEDFDVIFLDLSLPDAIPSEALSLLKPHVQDTPVIVLSGMGDIQQALQSLQEGAQDYLIKDNLNVTWLDKSIYYSIERMKYTQRLIESERRFRYIASQFPKGVIAILDEHFRFTMILGGELEGFAMDANALKGKLFTGLFPAQETERITNEFRQAFTGEKVSFEVQYMGLHFLVSAVCMNEEPDLPDSLLVVFQNITDVRRTAERLHFQSTVLTNITDGVIVCDAENKIVYWSRAAGEISGYSDREMLGRTISLLANGMQEIADPATIHEHLGFHEAFETTVKIRHKKGELIWVEMNVTHNYDVNNTITGLVYVLKDVTERKAEEHLLTLFQSVILNTNDAVIITESKPDQKKGQHKIVFVNRAFTNMTGYVQKEVIGQTPLMLLGPDSNLDELARVTEAMEKWEPVETELIYYRKNGSKLWVNLTITPVSNHSGNFTHWVYIQRDNTESRKAAEELRKQNDELTKTNRELDRFVYSTSHDLRAPLTSILGLLALMRSDDNRSSYAIYQDKIQESVMRLDRLIQNIISYSRNSRLKRQFVEINFNEILESTISIHRFMHNPENLHYTIENSLEDPFYSDPERWQIILNNFVSNSMKFYHRDRGINISIRIFEQDGQVSFVYEDNGIGIPQDQIGLIFEMFYRANEVAPGSGLGLYIVKQTVEILNGTIQVESKHGDFTRFTLNLPISTLAPGKYA